jgi:patatin-like phospholipase/acyl hydrolase
MVTASRQFVEKRETLPDLEKAMIAVPIYFPAHKCVTNRVFLRHDYVLERAQN